MTVEEVMEWLRRNDGRLMDIFGLWVQGKRDDRWVAEKLIAEGHVAALRSGAEVAAAPGLDVLLEAVAMQAIQEAAPTGNEPLTWSNGVGVGISVMKRLTLARLTAKP